MKHFISVLAAFTIALTAILCACSDATVEAASQTFTHPAAAYSVALPEGHAVRPFLDDFGVPYYVLTDDRSESPHDIRRGIWIIAFPIPSDDQLDAKAIAPIITALITVAEPGLKIGEDRVAAKIGKLDALTMSVEGDRKVAGAWKGRLHVAVQDDNFLVVHYGSPPAEFDAVKGKYDAAVASMIAPLPIRPVSNPARPAKPITEEEAKQLLKLCTPRIRVLARSDVKDEDTLTIDYASGTGFLIDPAGYVITNRHVVESNVYPKMTRLCYDPVELHFDKSLNIKPQRAKVVAVSQQWDLALLKIEGSAKWPTAPLADPSQVKAGHKLLVAGWPEPAKYGKENVTIAPGKVLGIEADSRSRATRIQHDAFTRPGSSGGPVFDMDLGAIVAAHYMAYTIRSQVNGVWEEMPGGFKGGVPVSRLLWEFPQVAADWKDQARGIDARRALVAYFLLQERFGAAFIEAEKAIKEKPDDGKTNAYIYRMYALQRDTERAQESLLAARRKPESSYPVVLFASQAAIENDDVTLAGQWNIQAFQMAPTHPASHLSHVRATVASGGIGAPQFIQMAGNAMLNAPNPELEMLSGLSALTLYLKTYNVIRLPPRQPPPQQTLIDAILAFEKSIELWPARQGISWANLGILHAIDGRKKKAYECRDKALRASPNDVFTRLAVAHFDLLHGDYQSARIQIAQANQIRSMSFSLFLTGWANLLEARAIANVNLPQARQLAAIGKAQIHHATDGPTRHAWWRSYAAGVSSDILR